jgi:6-pyruvoyltetrahydropterin/6-carboxytetrahydropterin synthase
MISIEREYTFDAAHMLPEHEGDCKFIHGHTYKVLVEIEALDISPISTEDMVIDFKELDNVVKPILDLMDHSFLIGNHEAYDKLLELLSPEFNHHFRIYKITSNQTTAEMIAAHIGMRLKDALETGLYLRKVTVYETPRSKAIYRPLK